MAEGVRVFGLRHLAEVVKLLNQPDAFQPMVPSLEPEAASKEPGAALDFVDVRGRAQPSERSRSPPRAITTSS